ncbi:galactose oxidase [Mycena maculata]|uniref:Galactose oxidase n=1 Tax=Mycena maculata TaxID=230809 RepID=A0AAD7NJC9_9AGAR|nr:galactose oxidase [Mycena maculata]
MGRRARVPHKGASTTVAGSKLYLFGGCTSTSERRLLSSLFIFDLELWKWERVTPAAGDPVPKPRHFHTADIWKNHLVVFGGLGDRGNGARPDQLQVLNDVRLFNLSTRRWLPPSRVPAVSPLKAVPRPRHGHLSCVSSNHLFIIGGKDFFGERLDDVCVYDLAKKEWTQRQPYSPTCNLTHAFSSTSRWRVCAPQPDPLQPGSIDSRVSPTPTPLSYSDRVTITSLHDIYVYNCDHPERKLEVLSSLPSGEIQMKNPPPGALGQIPSLRFPSVSGNQSVEDDKHAFFLWTLDITTNTWSPIDTGEILNNGSWSRGCVWHAQNKFVIFKNRAPGIDVSTPLVPSWEEVAVVDLEALGIYQPPALKLDTAGQVLALASLADTIQEDFEFLCDDERRIPCSRRVIAERWPWFEQQQERLSRSDATSVTHGQGTIITLTATSCALSQSYPVTMALLQYFYSMTLGTALQRAPAVLSYLLLISTEFRISQLQALVKHAMHLALSETTASGVYEIAASCGCRSLQIR